MGGELTAILSQKGLPMWFVVLGVLSIAMKLGEFGPVAQWEWWWVLSPFALALVWWIGSDAMGLTKKHEMDKMEAKKAERRRKNLENLGLYDPRNKSQKKEVDVRQRVAQKVEAKRSRIREENKEVVRHSRLDSKDSTSFLPSEPPAKP
jgi:small Trp-rich protein